MNFTVGKFIDCFKQHVHTYTATLINRNTVHAEEKLSDPNSSNSRAAAELE